MFDQERTFQIESHGLYETRNRYIEVILNPKFGLVKFEQDDGTEMTISLIDAKELAKWILNK